MRLGSSPVQRYALFYTAGIAFYILYHVLATIASIKHPLLYIALNGSMVAVFLALVIVLGERRPRGLLAGAAALILGQATAYTLILLYNAP